MRSKETYILYFCWLAVALGVLGSFYFSYIKNLEPCHLCWYQRICLFPMALILPIGLYKGMKDLAIFCWPFSIIGLVLALYQIAIQEIPGWNPIDICGSGPSCTDRIAILGPITLPMLSAALFLFLLAIFSWLASKKPTQN
jgi:disulfide bond formation protein DsbB